MERSLGRSSLWHGRRSRPDDRLRTPRRESRFRFDPRTDQTDPSPRPAAIFLVDWNGTMTGNGVSFKEQAANRMERQGRILNAAQIEGMRKVCRVGSTSHSRPSPPPLHADVCSYLLSSQGRYSTLRLRTSGQASPRSRLTRSCTTSASSAIRTLPRSVTTSSRGRCAPP